MTLETRVLLAAGSLGIDIGSSLGFVDLMQEAPAFQPLVNGTTLAVDANGWPLGDAKVSVINELVNQPYNGPDPAAQTPDIGGTYHLSFQGKATIGADYYGNFTVANQIYNSSSNTTTADLVVAHHTIASMTIDFQNTSNPASTTGAGVANVKLIQPGYAANTTQVFTTSMLNALSPFSTIRYLNADGANALGSIYNVGYQGFSTSSFTVPAGTHTLTFQGLNPTDYATAFIDSVTLVPDVVVSPTEAQNPNALMTVSDPSFESDHLPAMGYAYNPTGTPWTFAGKSGLTADQSAFTATNPNAPDGTQVAFLQNTGTITQTLTSGSAGSYHINFQAMQRNNYQYTGQTFNVLIDGKVVGTFSPTIVRMSSLDWAQRKLPTAASQVAGPGAPGEAWENMIALANASNTNLWINIPGNATNDYITQLAKLVKGTTVNGVQVGGLNPNLKVYLEYSNEVWGGIYNNFLYEYYAAQFALNNGDTALANDGTTDNYQISQRYYLEQTMNATNIFRSVLGADPTFAKIRPVLGSGENNPGYFAAVLPWFEKTYGAPSQYFYGMGEANYANPTDFSSVDNLFASLYADLPSQAATATAYASIATFYGLHSVAYEGGPQTGIAPTAAGGQVALAASRDPRMEDYIQKLYNTWYAAGGDIAAVYEGPAGIYSPGNQYPLVEQADLANPGNSPKWRGFYDLSQAAPTAVASPPAVGATAATALSTAADSTGQAFVAPTAGQTNYWLLNVATAGTYDLVLQVPSGSAAGQVTVAVGDQSTVGSYAVAPGTNAVLAKLTLHAGLNTLRLTTTSPFTVTALSVTPDVPYIADPGFESDRVGTAQTSFVYNPTGTPWTFAGLSGVAANNTYFTNGNPAAPDGNQVAFLQNTGTISGTASVFVAGNYHLTFAVAQRQNYGTTQTFRVLVDGKVVMTYTPSSYSYMTVSTPTLALAAGSHTIVFQGMNASGDATAFLDGVNLVLGYAAPILGDTGFETLRQGTSPISYVYNPTGSAWTFSSRSGVSANNTYFTNGNPPAPDGTQVAFLQNTGSISQTTTIFTAGTYSISFAAAQRGNWKPIVQTVQVLIDGKSIGSFSPSGTSYQPFSTLAVSLTTGQHIITLQGTNPTDDATAFVDTVAINPVSVPMTSSQSAAATPAKAAALAGPVPLAGVEPVAAVARPAVTVAAAAVKRHRRHGFPTLS